MTGCDYFDNRIFVMGFSELLCKLLSIPFKLSTTPLHVNTSGVDLNSTSNCDKHMVLSSKYITGPPLDLRLTSNHRMTLILPLYAVSTWLKYTMMTYLVPIPFTN